MSDRVLSTATAKQSIVRMQQLINGPLLEQINSLNREGQTLSDPNNWDGRLAQQFRGEWPDIYRTLMTAKDQLEQLRNQVQQINDNIMQAGGN